MQVYKSTKQKSSLPSNFYDRFEFTPHLSDGNDLTMYNYISSGEIIRVGDLAHITIVFSNISTTGTPISELRVQGINPSPISKDFLGVVKFFGANTSPNYTELNAITENGYIKLLGKNDNSNKNTILSSISFLRGNLEISGTYKTNFMNPIIH